jgi:hypothetical protein
MSQRLTIVLTGVVVIGALVILNTLTYVKSDKSHDFEVTPNRSTYHSGPTGTLALYDLLNESGRQVMRWRETPGKLLKQPGSSVTTFVVIGPTRIEFSKDDVHALLQWVEQGGRLVLIDRGPDRSLLPRSKHWNVSPVQMDYPTLDVDPSDTKQMTERVVALQPVQPTLLTRDIQAVIPSRFASRIRIDSVGKPDEEGFDDENGAAESSRAPVIHIADQTGGLLVDYAHGNGTITLLTDPYIVANGGITLRDNLQLAINTIAPYQGLIAFDEYHQGRGLTENPIAGYFSGTPVLAFAAQLAALVIFLIWTRARRFGRPLPLPHADRRSTLEFVASMSEIQERAKAYDLAIENIYSRTRRVLARYAGVDYNSPRSVIAARVAARSSIDQRRLETLMQQCENTINGEPTSWRQAIDLVKRLREVEQTLGLGMRSRDMRQAAEKMASS